ncbi:myb-like protein X [Mya arenaria]|nr:myb-like protein X [Mya arenaria]
MYSVVPRPQIIDHRPKSGEPTAEIIDHRNAKPTFTKWKDRRRAEQLPYDTLREQRDALLNAEFKYKHRIKELEKQNEEMVQMYENTYQENKKLKSIIEHGPDAAKMKQLKLDTKEQKSLIDELKDEIQTLQENVAELEKFYGIPKDYHLEKNWKEALARVRRKREEEDAIPTQGPFAGTKLFKKRLVAISDDRIADQDSYDLTLDSLEKETQVLLNKVRQLKREKEQIDYTLMMGKGAVSRNAVVAKAINEKLNRDLNKFAIRLEKLKLKHKAAKQYQSSVTEVSVGLNDQEESQTPSEDKRNIAAAPKSVKTFKSRSKQGPEIIDDENDKPNNIELTTQENTNSERSKSTNSKVTVKSSKSARGSKTGSKLSKSRVKSSSADDVRTDHLKYDKIEIGEESHGNPSMKEDSEDKKAIGVAKSSTKSHAAESTVKTRKPIASTNAPKPIEYTNGRYTNGPEPIKFRNKAANTDSVKSKTENTQSSNVNPVNGKIAFPFRQTRRIKSNSENYVDSYDAVLNYLNQQSGQTNRKFGHNEAKRRYVGTDAPPSPVPISFTSDMHFVDGNGLRNIIGNSGIRGPAYQQSQYVYQ